MHLNTESVLKLLKYRQIDMICFFIQHNMNQIILSVTHSFQTLNNNHTFKSICFKETQGERTTLSDTVNIQSAESRK
jgi:hypothetical protein